MGMGAVQRVATLLAVCNRQLLETARRLLMRGGRRVHHKTTTTTCLLSRVDKTTTDEDRPQPAAVPASSGGELWRQSILMGEKCDPINFSGAIFYDCNGRRLSGAPPRSPRHTLWISNTGAGFSPLPPPGAASPKWIAGYERANLRSC